MSAELSIAQRGARRILAKNRGRILDRLHRKCSWCGSKKRLEIDHIVPLSLGGKTKWANLQILCRTCHVKKNAIDSSDWWASLSSADYEAVGRKISQAKLRQFSNPTRITAFYKKWIASLTPEDRVRRGKQLSVALKASWDRLSPEQRSARGRHARRGLGAHLTPEHRAKISASLRGRPKSLRHCRNISIAKKAANVRY